MTQAEREKMIVDNMPLVIYLISKSNFFGQKHRREFDDVLQQGYLELIYAVDNYDSSLGYKFSTYLSNRIKKALFDSRKALELIPIKEDKYHLKHGFGIKTGHLSIKNISTLEKNLKNIIPSKFEYSITDKSCSSQEDLELAISRIKNKEKAKCLTCQKELEFSITKTNKKTYLRKWCSRDCQIKYAHNRVPNIKILKKDVKKLGYRGAARKYGVTDTTIRKWINK